MANLAETTTYDSGVYQLEVTDAVIGGAAGISNTPLKNLANRTNYLKSHLDAIEAGTFSLPGYAKLAGPAFTGNPTAPTPALGDNDTSLPTTAFVQATVGGRLSKSVAGGANVTLTAIEAGNAILDLSGVLTANISVIVPTSPTKSWIVKNGTSGAYTLTVKTSAGTGVLVTQGKILGVFTDGTNVYDSLTDFDTLVSKDSATGAAAMPTGSTAQRTGGAGGLRLNTDLSRFEGHDGTAWGSLGGATGGGTDAVFYMNDQTINNDFTVPATQNAMTAGPISIASGKTVTVSSGAVWSIV